MHPASSRPDAPRLSPRRGARTWSLVLLAVLAGSDAADAQFPFPWRRKKRNRPAPQGTTATLAPVVAADSGRERERAERPEPQPLPAAAPVPAPAAGPTPEQVQREERIRLVRDARARDFVRKVDAVNAEERMLAWGLVRAIDPADAEAVAGYDRARRDLDAALARDRSDQARAAADQAQRQIRTQLRGAIAAYDAGDLARAGRIADEVLDTHPDDPQAQSIRGAVAEATRVGARRRRLLLWAGLLGGAAVGLALLARWLPRRVAATDLPRARVRVIDGVGRGCMLPIDSDVFRVGAAQGEADDQRNELVLSDRARRVSRFHCTILRRGRRYVLLDSSLHGTWHNGERLGRGEQRILLDGDEFVVADAARVKFLRA